MAKTKNPKAKTLTPDNVLHALEEIDFENFIEPLRESLEAYRSAVKAKKAETAPSAATNSENTASEPMEQPATE